MMHGTINGYSNHKCRCDDCRAAWRGYTRELRRRKVGQPIPDSVGHGKVSTYTNWMCRCEPCTKAATANWMQWWRSKRP